MSSTWNKHNKKRNNKRAQDERRYTVRGVHRDPVDISKLSKALLGLVMAETERQAQAEHATKIVEPGITSGDETEPRGTHDA